ncbi:hypothetical protein RHMOL_Rhmol12G0036300 [Rhododendron molle]|uniref:Uncharacterized protein n=1 Tax=Rhododendron molle TaxID=49168 RepID=A0ACC0LDU6_RHOML|nr:hypothetical protein RHMOL_Rhmol12G0036300 [Rhododendron molle]
MGVFFFRASSKPAQFCTSLPVQVLPVSNHIPPDPILGDLPKIHRWSSSPIPAPPSSDDLLPNPLLPSSASPSPTRSCEKPLTKSTHFHLSVVEGVAGGREIAVDAVVVEIADGEIDEQYVGDEEVGGGGGERFGEKRNLSPALGMK